MTEASWSLFPGEFGNPYDKSSTVPLIEEARRVAATLRGANCICLAMGQAHNTTPEFRCVPKSIGGCRTFRLLKRAGSRLPVRNKLERRYGFGHWHFITCSCYRRMPLLATAKARDTFLKILSQVRDRYDFGLFGFVIMPEHVHLLISEPNIADPSMAMKVLKQRVSRAMRKRKRRAAIGQMHLWEEPALKRHARFWQPRYYDFNVWSAHKRNEKMNYMHFNPVKRGLAASPKDWACSSYNFYWKGEKGLCTPNPMWQSKNWRKSEEESSSRETRPCSRK